MTVVETMDRDSGDIHLRWIGRFHWALLPLGAVGWAAKGWEAALAFLAGGATSLGFWYLHRLMVGRMLTPSVRRRWLYALLGLGKLALIAWMLRGIMARLPGEALPLASGILLFVLAILLEAARLLFKPGSEADL